MAHTDAPYLVTLFSIFKVHVLWDTNMGTLTQFKTPFYHTWDGHTITFHGAMMILRELLQFYVRLTLLHRRSHQGVSQLAMALTPIPYLDPFSQFSKYVCALGHQHGHANTV
jgi:hypothetical protein